MKPTPPAAASRQVHRSSPEASSWQRRIDDFDWGSIRTDLEHHGHARLPRLLSVAECEQLTALYPDRQRFRSFIDMGARRFGEGSYRYLSNPLPPLVRGLRTHLYRRLAPVANDWHGRLDGTAPYPTSLRRFLGDCEKAGQTRPTPLLLRYPEGGFNCLHQDLYGAVSFPLQVACLLSRPESRHDSGDFAGGEFLLAEQRPRQQTRCEAVSLRQGEGLIFPNSMRPVEGKRGTLRAKMRHGASRVLRGERYVLGIIFHDAE